MALNKDVLVEMPPHCVKAENNAVYIQYTIRAYRNEKGKPTSERISIEKEDPETGKLIPNRNYYEYVKKEKSIELPAFVRSCGTYAAFSEVSRKSGLSKVFALEIIKVRNTIKSAKRESILTNQLIRSGTSIGANVREAFFARGRIG